MTEARIEKRLREAVKARGGFAFKWVSPGTAGVMDRVVLLPIPEKDREVVNRYLKLVEMKAPGKRQTPLQEKIAKRIEGIGYRVEVVDSLEKIEDIVS